MIKKVVQDAKDRGKMEREESRERNLRLGIKVKKFLHPVKPLKPLMKNLVEVKMVKGKAIYKI